MPEVLRTWKYSNSGFARYFTTRCDGPSQFIFKPMSGPASAKANTRSEDPEPLERFIETVVSTAPVPKRLYSLVLAVAIHAPSGERDSVDQVMGSLHPKHAKGTTTIRSHFISSRRKDTASTAWILLQIPRLGAYFAQRSLYCVLLSINDVLEGLRKFANGLQSIIIALYSFPMIRLASTRQGFGFFHRAIVICPREFCAYCMLIASRPAGT